MIRLIKPGSYFGIFKIKYTFLVLNFLIYKHQQRTYGIWRLIASLRDNQHTVAMKRLLLQLIAIILLPSAMAQPADPCQNNKNAVKYFNGFQHTKSDPSKINLTLSYAQALARECPAILQSLFHTFFAQAFSPHIRGNRDNANERKLLDLCINDTNQVLVQAARPIYLWVQIQENANNTADLIKLTNNFIDTQFNTLDLYDNRTARYALLIYQQINSNKKCSQTAQILLSKTTAALSNQINKYDLPADQVHNWKKAWYRYLYACIHFVQAEEAQHNGDLTNAEAFYRIASLYSPNETDRQVLSAYDYDKVFLQGKDSYHEDYLNFLASNPDKSKSLELLTKLTIENPVNISRLQLYYNEHYLANEPFDNYWERESNKNLQSAPDFTLQLLNNQPFSLGQQKGKWVLIDFWGTWCAPCLEEMPDMQSLYREITAKHPDKLSLITIACKDTPMKVKTFMNKYRYNFPVAMANADIEHEYTITAYPTKLLITPQGNILPIISGKNWLEQVKRYIHLK